MVKMACERLIEYICPQLVYETENGIKKHFMIKSKCKQLKEEKKMDKQPGLVVHICAPSCST